ncbi:MAG: hypothetical protein Q8L48_27645 [Archangium sp.]|nr:hypothetical protein [Archangium sp.]
MRSWNLVATLFVACPPPIAVVPAVSVEDFCAQYTEAECRFALRCQPHYDRLEGCLALKAGNAKDCLSSVAQSVRSGRAAWNGAVAAECLTALAEGNCAAPACDRVFTPQVAPGGACFEGVECADAGCLGLTCPGVCVAFKRVGAAVTDADVCEPGSYPYAGFCRARVAEGGSCAIIAPSFFPPFCEKGLACLGEVCRQPRPAGASCLDGEGCVEGWVCGGSRRADGSRTCIPLNVPQGGACSAAGTGLCRIDAYCDSIGPADGVCRARQPAGGPCTASLHCFSLQCVGAPVDGGTTPGRCFEQGQPGDPCSAERSCAFRSFCEGDGGAGVCVRSRSAGSACVTANECDSFTCQGGTCVEGAASLCSDLTPY